MSLTLHGISVVDTFAEAFPMTGTRLVITADSQRWVDIACRELCGYATSVIACDCEAGPERVLSADETPDGRPGAAVLVFGFGRDALAKSLSDRVGQCVLTTPTTACYNGIADAAKDRQVALGATLRFFGDGFQVSKKLGDRRFWRIPVMDGEFLCDAKVGTMSGVGGGNLIICGTDAPAALRAAEAAIDAISEVPDVITPFPGGIVRAGSKVGSKYKSLKASTNDAFCPTLRSQTETELPEGCEGVYEIVIDGLSEDAVRAAMKAGLHAACKCDNIVQITAGNYGGELGKFHFHLKELLAE